MGAEDILIIYSYYFYRKPFDVVPNAQQFDLGRLTWGDIAELDVNLPRFVSPSYPEFYDDGVSDAQGLGLKIGGPEDKRQAGTTLCEEPLKLFAVVGNAKVIQCESI